MSFSKALRLFTRWPSFAERYWWNSPDRPELGCFGTGYNGWGVQTNQKYLASLAVLASDPDFDEAACGMSREALLDRVRRALRFSLESHVEGSYHCTDGTKWGHTWISALGIERMMHGLDAMQDHLTDEDRTKIRRLLVSEADWLLDYKIQGTVWAHDGGNKPESNIWNGAISARAALMYPDELHAGDWMEKAHRFFINGISVRADAHDDTLLAGKPIRERHVGPNFFDHYALDHHSYLNVGYMVVCLSNIAMLHYGLTRRGIEPPQSLYHHAADLWQLIRRLVFADGRLCRIGGDSRQRYCYCQDYLLPTLIFAAGHLGDAHAAALARNQLKLIQAEQDANGSFLSRRLGYIGANNTHYFCRIESDKAVVLSMARYWGRGLKLPKTRQPFEDSVQGGWEEPEHGAMFHRCPTRIVSWSWRANLAESPQGLCLPPSNGHLAEWEKNLAGAVIPAAERHSEGKREQRLVRHKQWSFDGGFLTIGEVVDGLNVYIGEGWSAPETARHQIAFAALPDGHTAVRLEHARVPDRRVYLARIEGVRMNVPNDIFNKMKRRYITKNGDQIVRSRLGKRQVINLDSPWVNVEDSIGLIGVYGGDAWTILQHGERTGGYRGSILADVLCFPFREGFWDVYGSEVVLDTGCVILSSVDAAKTGGLFESGMARRLTCDEADARAVRVRALDGKTYILLANFSKTEGRVTAALEAEGNLCHISSGERVSARNGKLSLNLEPGMAALLRALP
ncbi:MAG: hypothetical protein AB1696_02495 [Planctomycetota bacterium]